MTATSEVITCHQSWKCKSCSFTGLVSFHDTI